MDLDSDSSSSSLLETLALPITEKPRRPVRHAGAHPALYIGAWIFCSNLTILLNKWLIDTAGFPYPVFITTWHMVFAAIATQILARTTRLLDGRKAVHMTSHKYLRAVVPIGLVYSASLVCSNMPYLFLSVPFIQMLKAAGPVITLAIQWLWGVARPTKTAALKVLVIAAGVALASAGEVRLSWRGVAYQAAGLVFEALRLVMTEALLANGSSSSSNGGNSNSNGNGAADAGARMDPLVSLYYYAPVCGVMNLGVLLCGATAEPRAALRAPALRQRAGVGALVLNAAAAFCLNFSSVFLIGKTNSLVLALSGIFKSILLVAVGVLIWGTPIAGLQMFGYLVALLGLFLYSVPSERIREWFTSTRSRLVLGRGTGT